MKKFKKTIKNKKGFTLVELIIAIFILGVILAMTTTLIVRSFDIVGDGTRRMSAKQLAEINLTEVSKYIRNGEEIEFDGNNNNIKKSDTGEIIINDVEYFDFDSDSNEVTFTKKVDNQQVTIVRKISPRN